MPAFGVAPFGLSLTHPPAGPATTAIRQQIGTKARPVFIRIDCTRTTLARQGVS